jgi:integral membrane protein (TIGR01906 family)
MDKQYIRLNTFIFSVLLGILFLLTPLLFLANTSKYYISRFEHYDVYEDFAKVPVNKVNVDKQFENLILHLSPLSINLNKSFYSTEDILHLYDVKNILTVLYSVYFVSLISLISFYKSKRDTLNINRAKKFSLFYIVAVTILGPIILFNFDSFFTLIHELSFSNDYWLLNPKSSNLIKFFPQKLFFEVFVIIIISNLLLHISFIMLSEKINGKRKTK